MSIVVNTNVNSILVQRSLGTSTSEIGKSLQRLSTGYRINKAADDAAGLTISESLKSQARGAQVASQNAQAGVNLLQTAEGDLGIIQDNLQRIRDLAVQAANDTNGSSERTAIESEVSQRLDEITRLSKASKFNTIGLLDGSSTALSLQIGANSGATTNAIDVAGGSVNPLGAADASSLGVSITAGSTLATASAASAYISTIDDAIADVSERRSTIGSMQNRLDSAIQSLSIKYENMSASESRIRDVDVAKEAASLTKNQILQQASATLLAQANQSPQVALALI
ncbi:MAG TPA: flagellin FliC [Cyanobacteria bacterium UBA9971]|nr:flagellin FliC [Cyanobacteria bacterium UBA9971]